MDFWLVITTLITGICIGFMLLFAIVALAIKAEDKTFVRETAGSFLQDLGGVLVKSASKKTIRI